MDLGKLPKRTMSRHDTAKVGGAPAGVAALRVTFWGALAMAITAGVGTLFGAVL